MRNLAKAMNIIQVGKEMSVHGYIYGKNSKTDSVGEREVKTYTFQVEVCPVSLLM